MGKACPCHEEVGLAEQELIRAWLDPDQVVPQHAGRVVDAVAAPAIIKERRVAAQRVGCVRVWRFDEEEGVPPGPVGAGPWEPLRLQALPTGVLQPKGCRPGQKTLMNLRMLAARSPAGG